MRIFLLFCSIALAACGDTDFSAPHNAAHAAPEQATDGVTLLSGAPSLADAQAAHPNGVIVRITNALQYPDGADSEPTRCHLSARLCARPPKVTTGQNNDDASDDLSRETARRYPDSTICVALGIINAGVSQTFHIDAARMGQALQWPERKAKLELQSSCQVTSLHYPTSHKLVIDDDLEHHQQSFDIEVTRAHWAGWEATLTESISRD